MEQIGMASIRHGFSALGIDPNTLNPQPLAA